MDKDFPATTNFPASDLTRGQARAALLCVLLLALGVRLLGCFDGGLPWTFYKDEENNVERALRFAAEGSLNPKWFNKPTLGYYILLGEYGAYYGVGRVLGRFTGPEDFAVQWLLRPQALLLIGRINAALFGTIGIWLAYLLARRLSSRRVALAAAIALAAMMGHLASSQEVKKDIVAAAFATASAISMFALQRRGLTKDYLRCGFLAGLSMATKYYAVAFFIPILWAHCFRSQAARAEEPRLLRAPRLWFCVASFFAGFFCGSPWNFLSTQFWDERVLPQLRFMLSRLQLGSLWQSPADAHAGVLDPEANSILDSALYMLERLGSAEGAGFALCALALLGTVGLMRGSRRSSSGAWALLCIATASVGLVAAFANAQFSEARHLCTLYPFVAILAAAGITWIAHIVGARSKRLRVGPVLLMTALVLVPVPEFPGPVIVTRTLERRQEDPRVSALHWMEANVPADSVVLNDRDWVPLQPGVLRCDKVLEQLERLRADAESHLTAQEQETDPVRRAAARAQAQAALERTAAYGQRWRLQRRAALEAVRPTWDVITLDQDWFTEDLNKRSTASGGYNPLPPRSPFGHVLREVLADAQLRRRQLNSTVVMEELEQRLTTLFRRAATAAVAARKPLPDDVEAAIAERVARDRVYFGLGTGKLHAAMLWTEATPVSARWFTRTPQEDGRGKLRPAAWFVTAQHNYEAYDNERAEHKRSNFPDWAAFYDDVRAHYHCWEFGSGSVDNRRIIRVYDLRTRVEAPEVRRP